MINLSGVKDNEGLLSRVMTTCSGPLLAGDALVKTLGYSSSEALRQASRRKMTPVQLFDIPGRIAKYALCAEVADWLVHQRVINGGKPLDLNFDTVQSKSMILKLFLLDYGFLLHEEDLIELLKIENRKELVKKHDKGELPFALFRIDHRQTRLFALSLEAFNYFV